MSPVVRRGWQDADDWIAGKNAQTVGDLLELYADLRQVIDDEPYARDEPTKPHERGAAGWDGRDLERSLGATPMTRQTILGEYDEGYYARCRAEMTAVRERLRRSPTAVDRARAPET